MKLLEETEKQFKFIELRISDACKNNWNGKIKKHPLW